MCDPKADIGSAEAKARFVRRAVIQHTEMLRSWANVRYAGCSCSILTERRRARKGQILQLNFYDLMAARVAGLVARRFRFLGLRFLDKPNALGR